MTRLKDTSETVIGLTFLVMNLEKRLKFTFVQFFKRINCFPVKSTLLNKF